MRNVEVIDEREVATKVNCEIYYIVLVFVARFDTSHAVDS